MADSSTGLTVRLPCDWLNVKHNWEYQLEGRALVSDAALSLVQMPKGTSINSISVGRMASTSGNPEYSRQRHPPYSQSQPELCQPGDWETHPAC